MSPVVNAAITRPDQSLIARFRALRFEVLLQMGAPLQLMDPQIKPLGLRNWRIAGPAVTVAPDDGDLMGGIAAVGVAQPGDVVVVAAGGQCDHGSWGGGLTLSAQNVGCEGVIVDGAAMDGAAILKRGLPVFCRTSVFAHTVAAKPGSINVPVRCGGATVNPGDLILGEMDGVMVLRREDLDAVIGEAEARTARMTIAADRLQADKATLFDLRGGRAMLEGLGVRWID